MSTAALQEVFRGLWPVREADFSAEVKRARNLLAMGSEIHPSAWRSPAGSWPLRRRTCARSRSGARDSSERSPAQAPAALLLWTQTP